MIGYGTFSRLTTNMTKPDLKYIVHRFYALLYLLVSLIIGGVLLQQAPPTSLRLSGALAMLVGVVLAHWYQITSITPKTIAEHSDEE